MQIKKPGTTIDKDGMCNFTVWAPEKEAMTLHIVHPTEQTVQMSKDEWGSFTVDVKTPTGTRYYYEPDWKGKFPDPASHYQPDGVHGVSEVVDHSAFQWTDQNWTNLPFSSYIIYELHIGTFTQEGTFEAAIKQLDDLAEIGVNAIELMPVSQFPGGRNWGYDGVFPYAVQNTYGGPEGLKKLIDACHAKKIAVILDVVYNHLGPEGNYLDNFGPYFTKAYCTPWGDAINFDGAWSDGVREYFSENALYWMETYHFDALRLDAIHTIIDIGAVHFWELTEAKIRRLEQKLGKALYMIAESDLNSPKVVTPPRQGGWGFTAQWLDDFHHSLYVILDHEGKKRYRDFGSMEQLAKAIKDGFVHTGEFVGFRKKKYGASSAHLEGHQFVAFNNNHDQSGNRVKGEKLNMLISFERQKIAATTLLLSPYIPMLFMGEEYADEAPFYYFVSHDDTDLIKMIQEGRKREFAVFNDAGDMPDPQAEKTFADCKLQWSKRNTGVHALTLKWYKTLIGIRHSNTSLQASEKDKIQVAAIGEQGIAMTRHNEDGGDETLIVINFTDTGLTYPLPGKNWKKILDSKAAEWIEKEGEYSESTIENGVLHLQPESAVILRS